MRHTTSSSWVRASGDETTCLSDEIIVFLANATTACAKRPDAAASVVLAGATRARQRQSCEARALLSFRTLRRRLTISCLYSASVMRTWNSTTVSDMPTGSASESSEYSYSCNADCDWPWTQPNKKGDEGMRTPLQQYQLKESGSGGCSWRL